MRADAAGPYCYRNLDCEALALREKCAAYYRSHREELNRKQRERRAKARRLNYAGAVEGTGRGDST